MQVSPFTLSPTESSGNAHLLRVNERGGEGGISQESLKGGQHEGCVTDNLIGVNSCTNRGIVEFLSAGKIDRA